MRPNRVVLEADSDEAIAIIRELYSPLYFDWNAFRCNKYWKPELIKYAANAFLATKISFINEIANFYDKIGADVPYVASGMGLDNRIGKKFLHPGPGFGGLCFAKDTYTLLHAGEQHDVNFQILRSVVNVNEQQRDVMIQKIKQPVGSLKNKTLGVLGLSFKPNTDDMRKAPSVSIIRTLVSEGVTVKAFDPVAMESAKNFTRINLLRRYLRSRHK